MDDTALGNNVPPFDYRPEEYSDECKLGINLCIFSFVCVYQKLFIF